jgi:hypothetical protein
MRAIPIWFVKLVPYAVASDSGAKPADEAAADVIVNGCDVWAKAAQDKERRVNTVLTMKRHLAFVGPRASIIVSLIISATSVSQVFAQDPREIVRKSVEIDQANWLRMKDYTWVARLTERHLDPDGRIKRENKRAWETVILYGEPHRRDLERDGKPLSANEQRKEQEKLDRYVSKLQHETEAQKQRRLTDYEKNRQKDREFLTEIPELYDFRLEGDDTVDGRDVWVISAVPKSGYQPKHGDAKPLLKIKGKLWIDKSEYQWVRLEAETTGTISYGLFLARLNPGAKLVFEQTRINDELWLPKREFARGSGRVGLLKKIDMEQELTWSNYRKFQVESKVVQTPP